MQSSWPSSAHHEDGGGASTPFFLSSSPPPHPVIAHTYCLVNVDGSSFPTSLVAPWGRSCSLFISIVPTSTISHLQQAIYKYIPNKCMSSCGRHILRWLWWILTLSNLLPLSAGGTCDLLLTNRICQQWWGITSMMRFHYVAKMMRSHLYFYAIMCRLLKFLNLDVQMV